MSDDDRDPVFINATETLFEVEAGRREALGRLGFRQRAEMIMHFEKRADDIMHTEAMEAAEMEAAGIAPPPPTDYEAEQRAAVEEEENLFGRRLIMLLQAEAFARKSLEFLFYDLADCINGAFKPCVTKVYSHAWGTYVYKVLPVKPHSLDRLGKHSERHLPPFMWAENIQQTESFQEFVHQEHNEQFRQSIAALEPPMQNLQIEA